MVRILIIGHGAREHAMAEAIVRGDGDLYAFMGNNNPGIRSLAKNNVKIGNLSDFQAIASFGKDSKVDFVIIGPEAPLTLGITNALMAYGLQTIGPTIECAQLEGSKIFMRNLLKKYQVEANIQFQYFNLMEGIPDFINEIKQENVVVKPDGLTGGKGVKIFGEHLQNKEDILEYCEEIFNHNGKVIIEEKLEGEEFTIICFVDGTHVLGTPVVQDNKRAFNGDKGPNTGGMGSYSMANHLMPFISKDDINYAIKQIIDVIKAIKLELNEEYKGILYGQFMKTAKGIKFVEFNIRFGDPEAMNILPILKSNFVEICQQILTGNLPSSIEFSKKATVCKYLVPNGYPTKPISNKPVQFNYPKLEEIGAKIYYASVDKRGEEIFTTTSRAIAVLGIADTILEAEKIAEEATKYIEGELFHRTDIATPEMLEKRLEHMNAVLK